MVFLAPALLIFFCAAIFRAACPKWTRARRLQPRNSQAYAALDAIKKTSAKNANRSGWLFPAEMKAKSRGGLRPLNRFWKTRFQIKRSPALIARCALAAARISKSPTAPARKGIDFRTNGAQFMPPRWQTAFPKIRSA
jgi:hypothetical protein